MPKRLNEALQSVSGRQYKLNIITCIVCWAIGLAAFIPLTIYMFCHYASTNLWWLGFIPLIPVALISIIFGVGISWLNQQRKQALMREKETLSEKLSDKKD